MGQGKKTKREMVVLIRKLKRNRALKKTGKKTFSKNAAEATSASVE
jgi:hypothetical protein